MYNIFYSSTAWYKLNYEAGQHLNHTGQCAWAARQKRNTKKTTAGLVRFQQNQGTETECSFYHEQWHTQISAP